MYTKTDKNRSRTRRVAAPLDCPLPPANGGRGLGHQAPLAAPTATKLTELRPQILHLTNNAPARAAKHDVADLVVNWAVENDRLGWDPTRENAYLIDRDEVFPLEGEWAEEALFRLGLTHDEVVGKWLLRALRIHGRKHGERRPLANWSYADAATKALYVSCGPDLMVKAPGSEVVPNGTDGVLFHPAMSLPSWDPADHRSLGPILPRALTPQMMTGSWPSYDAESQELLLHGWILALLAGVRPLPMLSLLGPRGTGKSTLARGLLAVLAGEGQQPLPMPRERRDYEQALTTLPLVALDNVDEVLPDWFADLTASVLTGANIRRRKLRTDAATYQAPAPAGLLITSRTGIHLRDDIRDRSLPIYLSALPRRISDAELVRVVIEERDRLLTLFAEHGARALAGMAQAPTDVPTRFTDFGRFVVASSGGDGLAALGALEAQQLLLDATLGRFHAAAHKLPPAPGLDSVLIRGTATEVVESLGSAISLPPSAWRHLDAEALVRDLASLLRLQGWTVDEQVEAGGVGYRFIGPMLPFPEPARAGEVEARKL